MLIAALVFLLLGIVLMTIGALVESRERKAEDADLERQWDAYTAAMLNDRVLGRVIDDFRGWA